MTRSISLLASGFDLDADPRLSGLYHHIIDTVSLDELEAFRAGDGFSEQKSTPAPIDEIAEQPIPQPEKFDPNLRGRAEGEVGAIDHDLPLTVNDPVLAYLNYFKTPRGSAIVETGLAPRGTLPRNGAARTEGRGNPAGFDLSGPGRKRVPAAGGVQGGRARHVAVHVLCRAKIRTCKRPGGWTSARIRKRPREPPRAICATCTTSSATGTWPWPPIIPARARSSTPSSVPATPISGNCITAMSCPRKRMNYVPIILALTLISKDPGALRHRIRARTAR